METQKLSIEPCYNPYIYDGSALSNIIIFDNGEIVGKIGRGWIGSNNDGNNVLESLEIENRRRKRKLDLSANVAFVMTAHKKDYSNERELDLYVPASLLPGFRYLGELLGMETDKEKYYGLFFEFDFGATSEYSQKFPQLTEVKTRRVMFSRYSRTELTEKGEKVDKIKAILKDAGIDRYFDADKLLSHKDELINILQS